MYPPFFYTLHNNCSSCLKCILHDILSMSVCLCANIQENDCTALKLKYELAVHEKKEAENNLTKMVRLKLCI